jgi:hypothetical protein
MKGTCNGTVCNYTNTQGALCSGGVCDAQGVCVLTGSSSSSSTSSGSMSSTSSGVPPQLDSGVVDAQAN